MKFMQILFAILLSCIFGYTTSEALALVIIGAILPNLDEADRISGRFIIVKGPTHSIIIMILILVLSYFLPILFYVCIGVVGHVLIECFSSESKIQLFWPLTTRMHIPLFHQYKSTLLFTSIIITIILFIFFIDINTIINIIEVYINWIKNITFYCVDTFEYLISFMK